MEMMTAPLARVRAFGFQLVPTGGASAFRAPVALPVADREDVLQARRIIGEHLEELPQRNDPFRSHIPRLGASRTVWQWTNLATAVALFLTISGCLTPPAIQFIS